jgi:hypothetical protein
MPLESIEGAETVSVECNNPRCGSWSGPIELDGPATVDSRGKVTLPGGLPDCPVCANPRDYRVNGVEVILGV